MADLPWNSNVAPVIWTGSGVMFFSQDEHSARLETPDRRTHAPLEFLSPHHEVRGLSDRAPSDADVLNCLTDEDFQHPPPLPYLHAPPQLPCRAPASLKRSHTAAQLADRSIKRRTTADAHDGVTRTRALSAPPSTDTSAYMNAYMDTRPAEPLFPDLPAPVRRASRDSSRTASDADSEDGRGDTVRKGKWDAKEKQFLLHLVHCFQDRELREIALIGRRCGLMRGSRAFDKKLKRLVPFDKWRTRDHAAMRASLAHTLRENQWGMPDTRQRAVLENALAEAVASGGTVNAPFYHTV